jgi:hypothetical protein
MAATYEHMLFYRDDHRRHQDLVNSGDTVLLSLDEVSGIGMLQPENVVNPNKTTKSPAESLGRTVPKQPRRRCIEHSTTGAHVQMVESRRVA